MRQKFNPLRIKELGEDGSFSGYGNVFDVVDSYRDVVHKGAFKKSLAEHEKNGTMPKLLWQHDASEPIGVYTLMKEDDRGLYVEGKLALDSNVPLADKAHALLKMKAIDGLSIGFSVPAGGESYNKEKDVFDIKEIDLWETSIVTFAANPQSTVLEVRQAFDARGIPNKRELERFLRDAGFPAHNAKQLISGGYSALAGDDRDDQAEIVEALKKINSKLGENHDR